MIRAAIKAVAALLLLAFSGAQADSDYQVGAGDLLKIAVFDHTELGGDLRVSQSGVVTMPPIGALDVKGLSTQEIEKVLATQLEYKDVLRRAQVSVIVVEYVSQQVAVMGQVAKPGQYSLSEKRKVIDMLATAGGLLTDLAADDAILTRQDGTSMVLDLRKLFEGDLAMNVPVLPGDTLFVPKAPQFYIYGEVQRPGVYRLERHMSLSQAVAASGGLTPKGTERGVMVKRKDGAGKEQVLKAKQAGALLGEDVVLVKESLF